MFFSRLSWALLFVISSPLILAQAIYARRKTPRLPEAKEPNSGVIGCGQLLKVLFVGESTIAGVGAGKMDKALTGQTIDILSKTHQLEFQIIGHNGIKIHDLGDKLKEQNLSKWDLIIVCIGANDTTKLSRYNHWINGVSQLQTRLDVNPNSIIVWSKLPPMHLFTALPQPLRWIVGQRARLFDQGLKRFADGTERALYFETQFKTNKDYLAADLFHPSELAYEEWAKQLTDFIKPLIK